jgi:hypothetical protein
MDQGTELRRNGGKATILFKEILTELPSDQLRRSASKMTAKPALVELVLQPLRRPVADGKPRKKGSLCRPWILWESTAKIGNLMPGS